MAKEIKKVRGTARFFDDDSLEFIPQQTGSPVQKDVKKVRKSSFYKTNGEKESSMVMHLNVDANSTDPVAELTEDFDKLLKNVSPKAEKKLSGKKLMDEDGTTVYVSRKDHKMQICIVVDLEKEPLYKDFVYQQIFKIIKCFTYNTALIASAFPSPKSNGGK